MKRNELTRLIYVLSALSIWPALVLAGHLTRGSGPLLASSWTLSREAMADPAGATFAPSSLCATSATIFTNATTPANPHYGDNPVTLGVKFRADVGGFVTGVRFYKDALDSGSHVGQLWTSTGALLASATFVSETASGWQQVSFTSPVAISANTTYVVSNHTATGYPQDLNFFATTGVDSPPLHALKDGVDGGNGVYRYDGTSGPGFPDQSFGASNYYVDVVFSTTLNCDDGNPCTDDSCDPSSGCVHTPKPDGTSCSDGNACTTGDKCTSGQCVSGTPVTCAALDQCHVAGVCDPQTGVCSNPAAPDGTKCDDGEKCTANDACQAGKCAGTAVTCAALDQCHVAGVCDPQTGVCSNPAAPDGTKCDDGEKCTTNDICIRGICAGTPVTLVATCSITPSTINVNSQGPSFSMSVSMNDACTGSPVDASKLGAHAWISWAAGTPQPFPPDLTDPSTLSCFDPGESGIFDDPSARSFSGNTAALKFDLPADGHCSTLDGNRQDLIANLTAVRDNTKAYVCVASTVAGIPFNCCTTPTIRNRGVR